MNEKKKELIEKINSQTTEQLVEIALMLKDNVEENANIVMELILNELIDRMPKKEFVELCGKLE